MKPLAERLAGHDVVRAGARSFATTRTFQGQSCRLGHGCCI